MTTRGKLVFTLLLLAVVGFGVSRWWSKLKPASLRLAALLDRPARRMVDVHIDFRGFTIPDRFVIGYGLDYAGLYRELPAIYSLS